MTACNVIHCESPARDAGYCWRHWARWEAFGDPLASRKFYRMDELRLLSHVIEDASTGCWSWDGNRDGEGYCTTRLAGSPMMAHRAMYIVARGPIPNGMTLDHLCHNTDETCLGGPGCLHRTCVNPDHLEPASIGDNALRGNTVAARNAAATHCPSGHEYTPENTYVTTVGSRRCRACTREHIRRSKAKRRTAA